MPTNKELLERLKRKDEELERLKKANTQLVQGGGKCAADCRMAELLVESCRDHCPHHLDADACRNCGIALKAKEAGVDIAAAITKKE